MTSKQTPEFVALVAADAKVKGAALAFVDNAANRRTSADLEFTEKDAAAACQLGIVIGGSIGDRVSRAIVSYNMAARLAIEVGYLLLSVRTELPHGEFEVGVESMGLSARRAREHMQMAKFATALPKERRIELLSLPKSTVLTLAGADPEVVEQMLEDGDLNDLKDMSVRAMRQRMRELEANVIDITAERDATEAERDGALKRLNKRNQRDEDEGGVPLVMADLRAEIAALVKKAELAIDSFTPLGVELVGYRGHDEAGVWVEPTGRLAIAGLLALRLLADGAIKRYAEALELDYAAFEGKPDALAFLAPAEILAVAQEWPTLTSVHGHEAALRQHEREQAKPKGKGRPAAAPTLKGGK